MRESLFIAVLFCFVNIYSQKDNDYNKELLNMFEVSGTEQAYKSVVKQMFTMFKKQYPTVPAEIWKEMELEFKHQSMSELANLLSPVYKKHLTIEDLREIIIFYKTPVGQKLGNSAPLIMAESMQLGQEWGKKIGEQFIERMTSKGFERT
jgi:hypothetical protein